MRNVTALFLALLLVGAGTAYGQDTEYVFSPEPDTAYAAPFAVGIQNGARGISGPWDLDGDGLAEILVAQHSGAGGRVHVIENKGVDTWEYVYSTGFIDSSGSANNVRHAVGGDLDGDGNWEIITVMGVGYDTDENPDYVIGAYVWEHDGVEGSDNYGERPATIGNFYELDGSAQSSLYSQQLVVEDVDGDGQHELLLAANGPSAQDVFYVLSVTGTFETNGAGTGFEAWQIEHRVNARDDGNAFGGGSAMNILPADLDGDGNLELVHHAWNSYNFFNATVTGADTYLLPELTAANRNLQASAGIGDYVALFGGTVADIDDDGNDEVFWTNFQSGAVAVMDYDSGDDVLQITPETFAYDAVDIGASGGLAVGDADGDGRPELYSGSGYNASQYNAGDPSTYLHVAEFNGGDPTLSANWSVGTLDTSSPLDTTGFNVVYRDSAGVSSKYYLTALAKQGTSPTNSNDPIFVSMLAYLGDADGDGEDEIAMAFQGVDDSLAIYDEVWNETLGEQAWQVTPDWSGTENTERGGAFNPQTGEFLVTSRFGGAINVWGLDAATGETVDTLDTSGIAGGLFAINEIDVTSDGQIFAANLTLNAGTDAVKIYRWADQDATPEVVFEGNIGDGDTSGGDRYGDSFSVAGSGDDVRVYLSGTFQNDVAMFNWTGTAPMAAPEFFSVTGTEARGGTAEVPGEDAVWINGGGTSIKKVSTVDGAVLATVSGYDATMDIDYAVIDGGELLLVGPNTTGQFYVIDVTDEANPRQIAEIPAFGANSNAFGIGDVSFSDDKTVFVMNTNNGVAHYVLDYGYERTVRELVAAPARAFVRIVGLGDVAVAVEDRIVLPEDYKLSANYPNPFNPTTTFSFTLPVDQQVRVRIYDVTGRLVRTLVNDQLYPSGTHEITWDGTSDAGHQVASGTYFYSLEWKNFRTARTMVMVK